MAPPKSSNSMSSDESTCCVVINPVSIVVQVFIYIQPHHHRPILINISLHVMHVRVHFKRARFTIVLIIRVVLVVTCKGAWVHFIPIGLTFVWNCAVCRQKVNRRHKVTSLAPKVFQVAVNHVLGWEGHLNLSLRVSAKPIWEHTWRSKGPARTANLLVHDLWFAHCKGISCIVFFREAWVSFNHALFGSIFFMLLWESSWRYKISWHASYWFIIWVIPCSCDK